MRYFQEGLAHLHSVGKAGLEMVKYVGFDANVFKLLLESGLQILW